MIVFIQVTMTPVPIQYQHSTIRCHGNLYIYHGRHQRENQEDEQRQDQNLPGTRRNTDNDKLS
jgi:hypothetical protein